MKRYNNVLLYLTESAGSYNCALGSSVFIDDGNGLGRFVAENSVSSSSPLLWEFLHI